MSSPSPERRSLDLDRLRAGLGPFYRDIVVTARTASTNADLAEAARHGAPAGTVHTTEHQASGRGRLGRTFTMPPRSGIAVSVLLRPQVPATRWPWLPLVTGLAIADTVRGLGVDAAVKWPNDVLVDGERKLCGILLERVETGEGPAAVVGIGVNTTLTRDELPVETATSLWLENATETDRTAVLLVLLARLEEWFARWESAEVDELIDAFVAGCVTIGREVRIEVPDGTTQTGVATTVDELGRLVVDGRAHSAGDVRHVRPV